MEVDAQTPRTLGQEFAAERERQGLSRAEAAQRLHMSAWQIEALESGDYSRLPQGTFLRGFVRNYAKVLGIAPDAALGRLAESAPLGPAPKIVVHSQNIRFDPIGERLGNPYVKASALAVVFVALGFAVMYWWLFIRPAPPASSLSQNRGAPVPQNIAAAPVQAPEPVVPRPAPSEPVKAEPARVEPPKVEAPRKIEAPKTEPKAAANPPEPTRPAFAPPVVAPTPVPVSETVKAEPRRAGDRTLKLRFRGESWVEVKDRNGKVLMSRLNAPGSEAEVSGRPPFDVIIGNAPDVAMTYNDREFPLEPHTRVAVARFTLE